MSGVCEGPTKRLVDVVFGSFGRALKKMIHVHVGEILTYLGGDKNKVWRRCILEGTWKMRREVRAFRV